MRPISCNRDSATISRLVFKRMASNPFFAKGPAIDFVRRRPSDICACRRIPVVERQRRCAVNASIPPTGRAHLQTGLSTVGTWRAAESFRSSRRDQVENASVARLSVPCGWFALLDITVGAQKSSPRSSSAPQLQHHFVLSCSIRKNQNLY